MDGITKRRIRKKNLIKKRDHFSPSKLSTSLLFRKFFSSFSKIDKINLAKGKRKKNDRQKIDGV